MGRALIDDAPDLGSVFSRCPDHAKPIRRWRWRQKNFLEVEADDLPVGTDERLYLVDVVCTGMERGWSKHAFGKQLAVFCINGTAEQPRLKLVEWFD